MCLLFGHPIGVKAQTPQTRNGSIQVFISCVCIASHYYIIFFSNSSSYTLMKALVASLCKKTTSKKLISFQNKKPNYFTSEYNSLGILIDHRNRTSFRLH